MAGLRFVYLARAIDQAGSLDVTWYPDINLIKPALAERGIGTFDPGIAFSGTNKVEVGPEVEAINRHALDMCDGLIGWVPKGPSIGFWLEVERARVAGKPVVLVSGDAPRSWMLHGLLASGQVLSVRTWQEAVDIVAGTARVSLDQPEEFAAEVGELTPDSPAAVEVGELALKVAVVHRNHIPTRGREGDAGLDLYVAESTLIQKGEVKDVPTGIVNVDMPPGTWGMIVGRSSTIRRRKLHVNTGIIDNGYTGPLFAAVQNVGSDAHFIERGSRIAQLILMPLVAATVRDVAPADIRVTERGDAGFGSTGN